MPPLKFHSGFFTPTLDKEPDILRSGKLKGFKIGRNWKIPRKSINKYIDKNIERNSKK